MAKPISRRDDNPDPITEEPGSHPIGTGVGAALGGAAAGAAAGAVAGPIGTIAGATIGAIAGGYAGKATEEYFDPTAEDAYWRANFKNRPYAEAGKDYDYYRPAYEYGWESSSHFRDRNFVDVESDLATDWETRPDRADLDWEDARPAVEDAWKRVRYPNADDSTVDHKRAPR